MAQRVGIASLIHNPSVSSDGPRQLCQKTSTFIYLFFGDETVVHFIFCLLPCSSKMTSRHTTPGVGVWEGCRTVCTTGPSPITRFINSRRCTTTLPTPQTALCPPSILLRTHNLREIRMQYTGR